MLLVTASLRHCHQSLGHFHRMNLDLAILSGAQSDRTN